LLPRPGPAPRPLCGDDGRHDPPPPLGPGRGGPRRDDGGGADGCSGGVAARVVFGAERDPSVEVDPG
jgi:hypothetical protein